MGQSTQLEIDPITGPKSNGELLVEAYIDHKGQHEVTINSNKECFSALKEHIPFIEVPRYYLDGFGVSFDIQVQSPELGERLMAGSSLTLTSTAWLKVDQQTYQQTSTE